MSGEAVFTGGDGRFVASELARGPWNPAAQHGGAAAALLMRELERLSGEDGLVVARVTYELLRPVPLGELRVEAKVVRPRRRVQLLEGSLHTGEGVEVVRARALRVSRARAPAADSGPTAAPPPPDDVQESPPPFVPPYRPLFAPDAIEVRVVAGELGTGARTAWFRLLVPIVAGEEPTPLQRLAAAADFGNGISAVLDWNQYMFINPDLTVYVERSPVGEWICLEARTMIREGGVGIAESVLHDRQGRVGRAVQALLVAPR